jgi:hypothetical protein
MGPVVIGNFFARKIVLLLTIGFKNQGIMFKRCLFTMLVLLLGSGGFAYATPAGSGVDPVKPGKMEQLQPVPIRPLRVVQSMSGRPDRGFPHVDAVVFSDYLTPTYLHVFEMLMGRVAGVWVTGSPNFYRVRIRNASGPPVIVIDGMPFYSLNDNDVNSLVFMVPPQDVDRVEVIKNFSGAARYGFNAANGVIVIHTKRGERVMEEE